jgi:uncharacterized protein (TIGR03085 family)
MATPPLEVAERVRFTDLLLEVGPDAPTLCEGWTARDLAAHMITIERPDAWAGIGDARKFELTNQLHDRIVAAQKAKPWRQQVERVRRGPIAGPFAMRAIRERMFFREYVIHHEDLRRANGLKPRTDIPEVQLAAWDKAKTVGTYGLKRAPLPTGFGIELVRADTGERHTAVPGDTLLELRGEALELLLFAFGRRSAAEVDAHGPSDAVHTLVSGDWKV